MSDRPTPNQPKLPLRVREVAEAYAVEDAIGRAISYTYFERASGQPNVPSRFTKDAAREIAQTIARALTDEAENEEPRAGG